MTTLKGTIDTLKKELEKKGFGFVFYEENLKHRNLYITTAENEGDDCKSEQLTEGVTVWNFEFSPDGKTIAAAISPNNLVDERYMFQKLHVLDIEEPQQPLPFQIDMLSF